MPSVGLVVAVAAVAGLALTGALLGVALARDDGAEDGAATSIPSPGTSTTTSAAPASTTTSAAPPSTTTTSTPENSTTTLTPIEPIEPIEPEQDSDRYATYSYGQHDPQLLDLHRPTGYTGGGTLRPTVVYLHSGGWTSGSRVNLADFVAAQVDRGWMVAAVDFRLAPEFPYPSPNEDVDQVIRWLRANGPRLGVDPDGLVLIGTSSGGQLALAAAADPGRFMSPTLPDKLAATEPSVAAVVSVSGPSQLGPMYGQPDGWGPPTVHAYLGCTDECAPAQLEEASPLDMVTPTPAPGLFIFGELDTLVPADIQGYPLQEAWEDAGGTATVVVAADYGHNLAFGAGIDPEQFNRFLDDAVGR